MENITSDAKKICFIYCDINGIHSLNETVSKKNLYGYARLVALYYTIGFYVDSKFDKLIEKKFILYPDTINFTDETNSIHNITINDAIKKGIKNNIVISELKEDLKDVEVIISHDLPFHIKAIQVECFRTATSIEFNKMTLIDTISFGHEYSLPKLIELGKNLKVTKTKNYTTISTNLNLVMKIFFILYKKYKVDNTIL